MIGIYLVVVDKIVLDFMKLVKEVVGSMGIFWCEINCLFVMEVVVCFYILFLYLGDFIVGNILNKK